MFHYSGSLHSLLKRGVHWIEIIRKKLINRADSKNHLWSLSKDSRVCSLHFVDGKLTPLNPNPTLAMGYNADKRATLLSPPSGKRKRKLNFTLEVKGKKRKSTENLSVLPKAAHSESTKHAAEFMKKPVSNVLLILTFQAK